MPARCALWRFSGSESTANPYRERESGGGKIVVDFLIVITGNSRDVTSRLICRHHAPSRRAGITAISVRKFPLNDTSAVAPPLSRPPARQSFAALRHSGYRAQFATYFLAMMADNIEHVISYWVMFQKFHSPALAGFAARS